MADDRCVEMSFNVNNEDGIICNSDFKNSDEEFGWNDAAWLKQRSSFNAKRQCSPLNIYVLSPESFLCVDSLSCINIASGADEISTYVKRMGYTHVELPYHLFLSYDASVTKVFVNRLHCGGVGTIVSCEVDELCSHFAYEFANELVSFLFEFHIDGVHVTGPCDCHLHERRRVEELMRKSKSAMSDILLISDINVDIQNIDYICRLDWGRKLYQLISADNSHMDETRLSDVLTLSTDSSTVITIAQERQGVDTVTLIDSVRGNYMDKFSMMRVAQLLFMCLPSGKITTMGDEYAQFKHPRFGEPLEWFVLDFPAHYNFREYVAALNDLYLRQPALNSGGFAIVDTMAPKNKIAAFERDSDSGERLLVVVSISENDEIVKLVMDDSVKPRVIFCTCSDVRDSERSIVDCKDNILTLFIPRLSGVIVNLKANIIKFNL